MPRSDRTQDVDSWTMVIRPGRPTTTEPSVSLYDALIRARADDWPLIDDTDVDLPPIFREEEALNVPLAPDITLHIWPRGQRVLPARGRVAFDFLRAHGEGRYRPQTLQMMLDQAEQRTLACLVTASKAPDYDPLTETKFGGTVGVLALLTDMRVLLAVHSDHRRQHIGTALIQKLEQNLGRVTRDGANAILWVGRENIIGQQFCLSLPLYPMLTQNTAIGYTDRNSPDI